MKTIIDEAQENPKVVVVCSDGAIRGGYIAGAFFALKHEFPEIWQHVTDFTASSASIGGIFYEMAYGDSNPGKRLWTRDFGDPNLINFWNFFKPDKRMYDIDYLVDVVFMKNNSCDISKISKSSFGFYFPLIDYDSGRTVIFNNRFEDMSGADPNFDYRLINPDRVYDYIRAATAAPILFDKTINLNGHRYIDAGIRVPFFVGDGIFKDYKKIIITANGRLSLSNRLYYKFFGNLYAYLGKMLGAKLHPKYYKEIADKPNRYADYEKFLDGMGVDSDVFYIHPTEKLGGLFDNSQKTLEKNFMIGENDVKKYATQIQTFVFGSNS